MEERLKEGRTERQMKRKDEKVARTEGGHNRSEEEKGGGERQKRRICVSNT